MHARAISSRAAASVSRFPSCGSRNLWLSVEAFSRGFATRLSHDVYPLGCLTCHRVVSRPWLESRGSAGKLVSLLWTEHLGHSGNGGTTLEFLSPFLWRAPPIEMLRERREFSRARRERIPPLDLGGGNGAPLDVGGILMLPLVWRRVCRGTS